MIYANVMNIMSSIPLLFRHLCLTLWGADGWHHASTTGSLTTSQLAPVDLGLGLHHDVAIVDAPLLSLYPQLPSHCCEGS